MIGHNNKNSDYSNSSDELKYGEKAKEDNNNEFKLDVHYKNEIKAISVDKNEKIKDFKEKIIKKFQIPDDLEIRIIDYYDKTFYSVLKEDKTFNESNIYNHQDILIDYKKNGYWKSEENNNQVLVESNNEFKLEVHYKNEIKTISVDNNEKIKDFKEKIIKKFQIPDDLEIRIIDYYDKTFYSVLKEDKTFNESNIYNHQDILIDYKKDDQWKSDEGKPRLNPIHNNFERLVFAG